MCAMFSFLCLCGNELFRASPFSFSRNLPVLVVSSSLHCGVAVLYFLADLVLVRVIRTSILIDNSVYSCINLNSTQKLFEDIFRDSKNHNPDKQPINCRRPKVNIIVWFI